MEFPRDKRQNCQQRRRDAGENAGPIFWRQILDLGIKALQMLVAPVNVRIEFCFI
jgi:hypothetical protein